VFSQRVLIRDFECIEYLIPAIRNSTLLRSSTTLVMDHLRDIIHEETDNDLMSIKKALYWGKVSNDLAIFAWFGVALMTVTVVTILVVVTLQDIGVGLAIGGFLLAVCTTVQCLLLYRQKIAPI
jgi:hypothetical protein